MPSDPLLQWLIGLGLLWALVRLFRSKGRSGELKVRGTTTRRLRRGTYRSFHDLTLPTRDGTTQVDHVIVSKFGVFVIETKNLTGWIFGDEKSRKWTQSIYGNNYQFQNPLRQNYKHVKAVEDLLGVDSSCLHSVVVFVGDSEFKTPVPENVLRRRNLVRYVRSKTQVVLSDQQVRESIRVLKSARSSKSAGKRRHVKNLKRNRRNPICPRCGEAMVLRTAKRGPNAGGRFWGCSGFPQCRATRPLS